MELSHINKQGNATMVDVSNKLISMRTAKAKATMKLQPETLHRIKNGGTKKGDVLQVAQVAGIMAAKNTSSIIPMCHPLQLSSVDITFDFDTDENKLHIFSIVKVEGKTGVEMEALTVASVTALTIYDMCKAIDKEMIITDILLLEKSGGKSDYRRVL